MTDPVTGTGTDTDIHTAGALAPHPLLSAIGGRRGLIDSSVPSAVFVIANAVSRLSVAVVCAIASAGVIGVVRLLQRQPVRQAVSGLIGVAIAAAIALRLHRAEGFFLPGIAVNAVYAVAALVSVLVGRPGVGYLAGMLDPRLRDWRETRVLRRAATKATLIWAFVFGLRAVVQGALYAQHRTGWLGVAKIAMGWPLWGLAVAASYGLMRRAAPHLDGAGSALAQDEPSNIAS